MGPINLQHVGSSQTRVWICLLCISKQFLSTRVPEKTPHPPLCFLKDLLEQSASFLFLCGLLVANCNLCCPQVFQTSHWPALSIRLALSTCLDHICLSWSWCHVWCSPYLGVEWSDFLESSEHTLMFLCRGLNTDLLTWIWNVWGGFWGFLLGFFFFCIFFVSQDTFCQAWGK